MLLDGGVEGCIGCVWFCGMRGLLLLWKMSVSVEKGVKAWRYSG